MNMQRQSAEWLIRAVDLGGAHAVAKGRPSGLAIGLLGALALAACYDNSGLNTAAENAADGGGRRDAKLLTDTGPAKQDAKSLADSSPPDASNTGGTGGAGGSSGAGGGSGFGSGGAPAGTGGNLGDAGVRAPEVGDAVGNTDSGDVASTGGHAGAGGMAGSGGAGGTAGSGGHTGAGGIAGSGGTTAAGGAAGTGGTSVGGLKVSPSSVDFETVEVGATSALATVTVLNSGAAKTISPTIAGAGFALAGTTCTGTLARDASCTISVKFVPATVGAASGALTVGVATVALSGNGSETFSATEKIDLGTLLVNATASAVVQIVPAPSVTGLTCLASGADLTLASQTCPATGRVAAACTFTFTFKATTAGNKSDSVICSASGKVKQTVVTANVVTPAGLVISPSSAAFSAPVDATTTVTFSVANTGGSASGPITAAITAGAADFSILSNACAAPLPSLSVCTIQVAFRPTSAGAKTGTLTVTDATAGSTPATAALTGTGTAPAAVAITPGSADFGTVIIGASKTITLAMQNNGGTATDTLTVSIADAEFVITSDTCTGQPLAGQGQCTFAVRFTPATPAGQKSSPVRVTQTGGVLIATAQLTGFAQPHPTPAPLSTSPPTLDFGTTGGGTPVGSMRLTVTNGGSTTTGPLSVVKNDSASSVGGAAQFTFTTTCSAALAPADSCQIDVTFAPTTAGTFAAIFTVSDADVTHSTYGIAVGEAD